MNITKHIVTSANWDSGRGGKKVSGIVLHTMVGYMQPSENRFNDPASGVSVHYGVGMDGSLRQWVEEANTAWQAGNYSVNQTTIGIEHEDNGNYNDGVRTDAEYQASAELVADICRRYGFPADSSHIFIHKNVIDKSRYPGGTACPDGLDTNKIISMAAAKLGGEDMGKSPDLNDGDIVNALRWIGVDPDTQDSLNYRKTWASDKGGIGDWNKFFYDFQKQPAFINALKAKYGSAPADLVQLKPGKYEVK